jgi:hypothetical protein
MVGLTNPIRFDPWLTHQRAASTDSRTLKENTMETEQKNSTRIEKLVGRVAFAAWIAVMAVGVFAPVVFDSVHLDLSQIND